VDIFHKTSYPQSFLKLTGLLPRLD
jgi:hypothetical protein